MKPARILRADRLQHSMNVGKEQRLAQFIRDYRAVAVQIGPRQWRLFFQSGSVNKYLAATDLNYICGAAPVQMATQQVVEQIKSWVIEPMILLISCAVLNCLSNSGSNCMPSIAAALPFFSAPLKGINDDMRVLPSPDHAPRHGAASAAKPFAHLPKA